MSIGLWEGGKRGDGGEQRRAEQWQNLWSCLPPSPWSCRLAPVFLQHIPVPCAPAGLNILLVSRPESPLAACAADLEARYGVATRTCAVDLCVMGPQERRALEAALEGLEVGGWVGGGAA